MQIRLFVYEVLTRGYQKAVVNGAQATLRRRGNAEAVQRMRASFRDTVAAPRPTYRRRRRKCAVA
jgi:hypothetical protein